MKKLLFLFALLFATPAYAQSTYILDGRLISPAEFDAKKAAPIEFTRLAGKMGEKALQGIFEFDGETTWLLTENGKENLEDGHLEWYSPEYGIALFQFEYPSIYDVKNRRWLGKDFDPACTKASPDGSRRITCSPEFDGSRSYFYEEKDGDSYKALGQIDWCGIRDIKYYWVDNDTIKYLQYEAKDADEESFPAAGKLVDWPSMEFAPQEISPERYDRSKALQYKTQNLEEAQSALAGLLQQNEQQFVTMLKNRSGKDFFVSKYMVFKAYYPDLDVVTLAFEYLFGIGVPHNWSFNLCTGQVEEGTPNWWAVSPDGQYRVNHDNYVLLEKLGQNGFEKIASFYGIINPASGSIYWVDNETVHYLRIIGNGKERKLVPTAVKVTR